MSKRKKISEMELENFQKSLKEAMEPSHFDRINMLDNTLVNDELMFLPSREQLANEVASQLHENWRKTRLLPNGTFDPRWKVIKDEKFISALNPNELPKNIQINKEGQFEIDIANSSYNQLSADWQKENYEAAKVVAGLVLYNDRNPGKQRTMDQMGTIVHDEWLKRNDWAKGGELDVPFDKLPKNEQAKDLEQIDIAINAKINLKLKNRVMDKTPEQYSERVKNLSPSELHRLNQNINDLETKTPSNQYQNKFGKYLDDLTK